MIDDEIPDEATLLRETVEMGCRTLLYMDTISMKDDFGEKDYASAANHAYNVIVALQAAPEDPRVREAYGIFNEGARKIKQDTGSTDPLHQRILRHEKEVKELALMNFGRLDPENIQIKK